MVRAGVIRHPSEWPFSGYNEIQKPRRKNVLIAYQKLAKLAGAENYSEFQKVHKNIVEEALTQRAHARQPLWTESIAAGSKGFVEEIQDKLRMRSQQREIFACEDGCFELRETVASYNANFGIKNDDIASDNSYSWHPND